MTGSARRDWPAHKPAPSDTWQHLSMFNVRKYLDFIGTTVDFIGTTVELHLFRKMEVVYGPVY